MGLMERLYVKYFVGDGHPYAAYLKRKKVFHRQGENCFIAKDANVTDPYLTSIGSNVWITSGCLLLGHDASVVMINVMRAGHRDRVGPVIIGDNCFLGNNAVIMPDTRIGSNTIVGTGSVVTRDIPDNAVHAGNPARFICSVDDYVKKIEAQTETYPWAALLKKNDTHIFDPALESDLRRERVNHFFRD